MMDMGTTGTENTLPEQEAPRKSGRPQQILMTSTANLVRLQSDLKEHVKGEYEFRDTRSKTRITTKEMVDYLAMNSYLEKNNLRYFTFSPNSEKPFKAVIRHLPPDKPAKDISNSLEDLGFSAINVRQLTTNQRAPNGQIHLETLSLFLVTLTRNVKSQSILKTNSLVIKVESYRAQTSKMLAMFGPTASELLDVCGAVVATCIGNAPKRRIQNIRRAASIAP
jgi:hypothetical protein